MDKSLAKGLTKRIFREHFETIDNKIHFLHLNGWNKNWKKNIKKFSTSWNDFTVSASEFGSKKKPWFGFSFLVPYDYNPQGWEEMQFGVHSLLFSRNHQELVDDESIHWLISHHAIQRFLERTNLVNPTTFENTPGLLQEELKYVSLWSLVLIHIFTKAISEDKNLEFYIDNFSLLIPAPNGVFLARMKSYDNKELERVGNSFSLRSFLPLKQLNDKQLKLRNRMIELGAALYNGPIELVVRNFAVIDPYQSNLLISWFRILLEFNSYLHSENFFDEYFNYVASEKFDRSMIEKIKLLIDKSPYSLPEDARKAVFTSWGGPEWLAEFHIKKEL